MNNLCQIRGGKKGFYFDYVPKMVERSLDNLFYVGFKGKVRIEEYTQIPDRGL